MAAATAVTLAAGACSQAQSQVKPPPRRATSAPAPPPVAAPPRPLRVMPFGDSITDGLGVPGGYRSDLWQMMVADGLRPDFVGSQFGGPAPLADKDHEGHGGWELGQLDAHAREWVVAARPDVILMHVGTNDLLHNKARAAPARFAKLLNDITGAAPQARVFVATVIPLGDRAYAALVRHYNQAISATVRAAAAAARPVGIVNMHSALTKGDISRDGIHPTEGGYSKMAASWYSAFRGIPLKRWEAENAGYAQVNDGERLRTPYASGNGKVGYLDDPQSFVEFALTVSAAGRYRMYVRAANGMPQPCTQRIIVNGRPFGVLRYLDYGFDKWTITATDIRLDAGHNSVRLAHDQCSAEIDAVEISRAGQL
jgi:lysophospholipase L1-like esterase